jgi:hypothetical protein
MALYPVFGAKMKSIRPSFGIAYLALILTVCFIGGCSKDSISRRTENKAQELAGTWKLKSRIIEEHVVPAEKRQLLFEFNKDSTFKTFYRPESGEKWVKAGEGALLYEPPNLVMYWDDGRETHLIVLERNEKLLKVHHGRNLAPLEDQRPQELFVSEDRPNGRSS